MDSLTQIVLGAAVGEATLGKKIGNKALLWGAIGGTIPDLDVFVGKLFDTVTELDIHRGFSHSILFSLLLAPVLGFIVNKWYQKSNEANWRDWTLLFFWALFTHPLLDSFTTWGTQIFWPMDYRVAFHSIFVIDPLYTLPFLISTIAVLFYQRESPIRRRWNRFGILYSTAYLGITLLIKTHVNEVVVDSLKQQQIQFESFQTRPTPFNTLLWATNVELEDDFLMGYYSLFDKQPKVIFKRIAKQHLLQREVEKENDFQRLQFLTKGYYTLEQFSDTLVMNDLRFGEFSGWNSIAETTNSVSEENDFVFTYYLTRDNEGQLVVHRKPNQMRKAKEAMNGLWNRLKGE
ncbi:metal-dependent hydrolase [Acidiluteibacter ferrifornacis]|uniref:Metal-dependent hydrolase n=1 Tax=Acidiluteibacter ferrifornacis TaxID=2692424 RepID=A0A6N9NPY3_9FLAO|nr:metal-dependent hydrolase [Acidiluteibacter ferrifornacis]NBG67350.1 metal-dependent hydrolase [Acidiluteibacter ferrifornacis]